VSYGPTHDDNKSIIGWILAVALFFVIAVPVAWGLGWFAAPFETTSVPNVRFISRQANEAHQALEAKERNITAARERVDSYETLYGADTSVWPQGKRDEYLQAQRDLDNDIAAYNRECGQYNALMDDEWRGVVAPEDLPPSCQFIE
jgi:hypothetical protein